MPILPGLVGTPTLGQTVQPVTTGKPVPDYGRDLWCLNDLDPAGAEVSGLQCLAQALYRRLITVRGTLIGDRNYGYDLTQLLNDDLSAADLPRIAASVDAEFLKDERVKASESVAQLMNGGVLNVTSLVTPSVGPTFRLTVAASALTVQLLQSPT